MVKGCDICGSSIKEGKYNQSIYIYVKMVNANVLILIGHSKN
ncbi:hypothetical protein [Bacillus cereus]|nr:hypothetical protein [Bacillus cereus]